MHPTGTTKQKRMLPIVVIALIALAGAGFFFIKQKAGQQVDQQTAEQETAGANQAQNPKSNEEQNNKTAQAEQVKAQPVATLDTKEEATTAKPAAPKVALPQEGCFTFTYEHQKLASHADGEACTEHKNLLSLETPNINFKSVCLRVNNTPVRYQIVKKGKTTNLVFDSVAGPHSVVTAQYCTGKLTCTDNCKVARDEFLDALGGSADIAGGDGNVVQWDGTKKAGKAEVDLDNELKDFKGEFVDKDNLNPHLFAGWIEKNHTNNCQSGQIRKLAGK